MNNTTIVKLDGSSIKAFAGCHPIHPQWCDMDDSKIEWMEEEWAETMIVLLAKGMKGGWAGTLSHGSIKSEPITNPLFILKKRMIGR